MKKNKELNKIDSSEIKKSEDKKKQVGEIDYAKHEQTLKELEREEEEILRKQKAGEAALWCPLDHEHGPHCVRPRGDCSHNHQKEIAIYERSTTEKIKAATAFKIAGNRLFREENYGLASVEYRKGLLQYDYTFADGDDEIKQVEDGKIALYLNLAACKIHLEDYKEALIQCRQALGINPNCTKALYRQGISEMASFDFNDAKTSLELALELEPANVTIHAALEACYKQIKEYQAKTKKMSEEMVNKMAQDENEKKAAAQIPVEEVKEPDTKVAEDTERKLIMEEAQNVQEIADRVLIQSGGKMPVLPQDRVSPKIEDLDHPPVLGQSDEMEEGSASESEERPPAGIRQRHQVTEAIPKEENRPKVCKDSEPANLTPKNKTDEKKKPVIREKKNSVSPSNRKTSQKKKTPAELKREALRFKDPTIYYLMIAALVFFFMTMCFGLIYAMMKM